MPVYPSTPWGRAPLDSSFDSSGPHHDVGGGSVLLFGEAFSSLVMLLNEQSAELFYGILVQGWENMAIRVEGQQDSAVPQEFLHDFRMHPHRK